MEKSTEIIELHPILGKPPRLDFNHNYLGFGRHESRCNVKAWEIDGNRVLIVFSDLGVGTSVTNASEQIITEVYAMHFKECDKSKLIFAETYPQHVGDQTFDLIIPKWDGDKVTSVDWKFLAKIEK